MSVAKKIVISDFAHVPKIFGHALYQLGPFLFLIITFGCVEPYFPEASEEVGDILVVDGFLNSTEQKARVKLSHATWLYSDSAFIPEKNAVVFLEEENGNSYPLSMTGVIYEASNIKVDNSKNYRLYIKTKNGKEYRSDYIQPKPAPEFDSVTWKPSPEGVTIYVNSHDPKGSTQYYQWSYTETWAYTSEYYASYKLVNGLVYPLKESEIFYYCWKTLESTEVLTTSTTQLSEDHVSNFPIIFIPKGTQRLSRAYSVLVRQKTLSEKTYNYLKQLERSTENLGGLFDPMPWQAEGNVRNINDSDEPVLGYFNASSVQEKRLTFSIHDFPTYLYAPVQKICDADTILTRNLYKYGDRILIGEVGSPPFGFTTSEIGCIDCRILGGTTKKPDFMP